VAEVVGDAGLRRTAALRWAAVVLLALMAATGLRVAAAGAAGGVTFTAAVNGQPAFQSSDAHPVQLYPAKPAAVRITVVNRNSSALRVATVRFEGQVLSLPLFSYDTGVNLVVPADRTKSLTFPLVLTGVGSQATGLVVASITLLQSSGAPIASQTLVTNVHGSLDSIYGLFGLVVLVLSVASLATALLAMARHTLPQNRWLRGLRFLVPGFGIGLILTFTLSAFHVFTPGPGHWLPLLIVPSGTGLALGFLTPAPDEEEYDDYDDNVLLAQIVVVDEDPLEAVPSRATIGPATPADGVPDGRPTLDPATPAVGVPDGRPTLDPATPAEGSEPDTRTTIVP
jgi:hypothetical protein